MSYRILARRDCDFTVEPGDLIILYDTVDDVRKELVRHEVKKERKIGGASIMEIENELGVKSGIVGVFEDA